MSEIDFGTALSEIYGEAKKWNTTPPEHSLSRKYRNARIRAWKVTEGVIRIEIEGDVETG